MSSLWSACVASGLLLLIVGFTHASIHAWLRPQADWGVLIGGFGLAMIIIGMVLRGMKKPELVS